MKKTVALMVSILFVLSLMLLSGCGSKGNKGTKTGDTTENSVVEEDYWNTLVTEYGGKYKDKDIKILTTRQLNIPPTEMGSSAIEEAMFLRDAKLEEDFGFMPKYDIVGDYQLSEKIQLQISVENNYDLIIAVPSLSAPMIMNDCLMDLNESNVDITNEWWNQSVNEATEFNGSVYMSMGPVSPYYYLNAQIIFINKTIYGNYFPDSDIYDIVRNGDWTLDKMVEIATSIGENGIIDNDSNWEYDENDTYGLTIEYPSAYSLTVSCGISLATKTEEGYSIDITNSNASDVIEKLRSLFSNSENMPASERFKTQTDSMPATVPMFAGSRSMMTSTGIGHYRDFKEMKEKYGVLPLPKYNKEQTEYITAGHVWGSNGIAIPKNTSDAEMSGCFMEAAGYYGFNFLKPVVYDTVLKFKAFDSPDDIDMLDNYIYSNVHYDINLLYDIGGSRTLLQNIIVGKEVRGLQSAMTAIEALIKSDLDKYNKIGQ